MNRYEAANEAYSLAWKDWYYWPLSDDEGCQKALERLEAAGKELNIAKKEGGTE